MHSGGETLSPLMLQKCSISNLRKLLKAQRKRIGTEMWGLCCFPSDSRGNFRENTFSLTDWNWTEVLALVVLIRVMLSRLLEAPPVSRETARLPLFWFSPSAPILSSIWHTSVNWGTCLTSLLVYRDVLISEFIFAKWQPSLIGFSLTLNVFITCQHIKMHDSGWLSLRCMCVLTFERNFSPQSFEKNKVFNELYCNCSAFYWAWPIKGLQLTIIFIPD